MYLFIIVAGIVWFALAGVMVLAFVCAAKRPWPESSIVPEPPDLHIGPMTSSSRELTKALGPETSTMPLAESGGEARQLC
jgi:hypothetical protein